MMEENGGYCEGSYVFYANYLVGIISRSHKVFLFIQYRYVNKKGPPLEAGLLFNIMFSLPSLFEKLFSYLISFDNSLTNFSISDGGILFGDNRRITHSWLNIYYNSSFVCSNR
jgi:hypothetical protein